MRVFANNLYQSATESATENLETTRAMPEYPLIIKDQVGVRVRLREVVAANRQVFQAFLHPKGG
jgi:hypothetical protein